MNRSSLLFAGAVAAVGLFVVVGSYGCGGNTACFEFTQGEYMANGNACPAPNDALTNFTDATCPGPVVSVDGPGSFDGLVCCYPVTQSSITPDCGGTGGASVIPLSSTDTETQPETSPGTDFCSETCSTEMSCHDCACTGSGNTCNQLCDSMVAGTVNFCTAGMTAGVMCAACVAAACGGVPLAFCM